jgi:alkanesulfonate monooxygenase SsuD/methylene tetrahydromethanopterin reductase-like flavin-dependent oxidoreductase (luciferase family)
LHDSIKLESWGIAATPVATHEFMSAARAQAAALGRADFDAVYVRHPVQDQTRAEMEAKADAVLEEIVGRLTAG